MYETAVESEQDLIARIVDVVGRIAEEPANFEREREAMVRRCRACINIGGRTFEQFL